MIFRRTGRAKKHHVVCRFALTSGPSMSLSADQVHVQSLLERTSDVRLRCADRLRSGLRIVALSGSLVVAFPAHGLAQAKGDIRVSPSPSAPTPQASAPTTAGKAANTSGSEEAPGGESRAVVPPIPRFTGVTYPAGATGDALVVLRFVVQEDGSVRDVEVVLGDEPFASAAAAAALTWVFDPARRGAERLAVRIEFQVTFEQKTVEVPVPTATDEMPVIGAGDLPAAEAEAGTAEAELQASAEVIVQEELPSGRQVLTRAAARQVPGGFGDPLRAVDVLPGVTAVVSGLPFFYVRGAPPANNGFFFDGVRLPFLYHAFLGPGAIHPEIIDAVNLYPGPYPARFGQHAGGIISADLRAPSGRFQFGAEVSLYEAGAFTEIPFAEGRGRVFVGGRYSYTALLASWLTSATAEFWNYQALIDYALTPRDRVSVLFLGAYDLAERDGIWESEFHRADLRYDRSIGDSTVARIAATVGFDRTSLNEGEIFDTVLGARTEITHRFSDVLKLDLGGSITNDSYELESFLERADPDILELFRSRDDTVYGGYAELTWKPASRVTLVPAVRVDQFRSGEQHELGVGPSLTATYRLSDAVQTTHGIGIANQTPNFIPNVAGARVAGLDGGLQKAVFTTSGVEARLPDDWVGAAAVFHNAIFAVTDVFGARQGLPLEVEAAKEERALGRSYGLELSLRRSLTRRFAGLLSYTLSRTTRTYDDFTSLSGSDRTHVLNLAALYTFGSNWRFGGRSVFYSGLPGGGDQVRLYDQERAAPFLRLDLRAERRFRLGDESYWSVVAEAQNVTFSKEVLRRTCRQMPDGVECSDTVVGPVVLPYLKVEARY